MRKEWVYSPRLIFVCQEMGGLLVAFLAKKKRGGSGHLRGVPTPPQP